MLIQFFCKLHVTVIGKRKLYVYSGLLAREQSYYFVLKRQNTFHLGLNATKITIIKEKVQIKIVQKSISYKKLGGFISMSPKSGARKLEFVFK